MSPYAAVQVKAFSKRSSSSQSGMVNLWLDKGRMQTKGPSLQAILAAQKHHAVFSNGISATRSIMNRLFVAVLRRFSILVRVGPVRRDATNKYLWRQDIFENFILFFAFPFFSCKGKMIRI